MTISEQVFEEYCTSRGIVFFRVPEGDARTPDYELSCGNETIVVEVKEIAPNQEERESDRQLAEHGVGLVISHTPGGRVRRKIRDSSRQIKARSACKHPSLLVVFDGGRRGGHVEAYNIRVAMYGLEQVYVAVPAPGGGSPHFTGTGYGPKRQMTPDDNTSISAVGALVTDSRHDISLIVYHNKFARVPFRATLLAQYGIEQFALGEGAPSGTAQWEPLENDGRPKGAS